MSEEESYEYEAESLPTEPENPLGLYEGERNKAGQRHGYGKAVLPNGDTYAGKYCEGTRHGRGVYVFKAGPRYDGDWRRNVKHGSGTFLYPDGSRYEGEWKRDERHGFGAYHYRNGDVYEGNWKSGLRHGLGTYTYASSGSKFYGTWILDRMQGAGQMIHNRHRFHGFWDVNLPVGRGCFVFGNSSLQHGYYALVSKVDDNALETDESLREEAAEEYEAEDARIAESLEGRPAPLRRGYASVWRARCVTAYAPELLPPDPMPLQEEVSEESLSDVCEYDEPDDRAEEYLKKDDVLFDDEGEEGGGSSGDYDDNYL
ncbi:radial spoke head 1 homolog [Copidosoma floridanum]|uniref:radial spoke head 1 homolog n=1 Tax=Copidosoma floridanum TaxID=29053 RepID=UPI0006C99767|nr:radial spoke head 1 homolog [Copidosoma floridanum]